MITTEIFNEFVSQAALSAKQRNGSNNTCAKSYCLAKSFAANCGGLLGIVRSVLNLSMRTQRLCSPIGR